MTARKTKSSNVVLLLSGPNLNLLGQREPQIYGTETLDDHVATCRAEAEKHGLTLEHLQSNHEGELIDAIHGARGRRAAIIINAGAFTHYSWAIHDALVTFEGVRSSCTSRTPTRVRRGGTRPWSRRWSTGRSSGSGAAATDSRRSQWPSCSGWPSRDGAAPRWIEARALAVCATRVRDAGCDALLVTHLVNVR